MSFFNELKRRNVFKVVIAYVVVAWLVMQVTDVVLNNITAPGWVFHVLMLFLAIGFPFAVIFAWAFEMTPEGFKRESEVDRSQSITPQTGKKLNVTITVVMALALGYFAYDKFVLSASRDAALVKAAKQEVSEQVDVMPQTSVETDNSIAVLPFVNMSGDQENEYFSDGLTEELLNALSRINELKVTGRTSSFAFKGKNTDLREIGQILGVTHILEGSVRKAQNRVRITAQLIKAKDGYHMWSDTFDRELDDIFAIQEEIATRVARELTSTLLGDTPGQLVHPGTSNAEAYEAYLRGRYLFLRKADDRQVQNETDQLYQRAIDLDPQFTLAWFGQFEVLNYRFRNGFVNYQEGAVQLRQLADKLIAMDPELPESHVASGRAAMVEMKLPEAEVAFNQALALNPGDINALNALSGLMSILNRKSETLEYARRALARDPLDLRAMLNVVGAYSELGQCAEATDVATRALSLAPGASRFYGSLGNCWSLQNGDYQKANDLYEKEPLDFIKLTGLAITSSKLGQQDKAQRYLGELIEIKGEAASYQFAQIYAQWGETEKALDALEHAWEIKDSGFTLINMDAHLDPIREQLRFKALLEIWQDPSRR